MNSPGKRIVRRLLEAGGISASAAVVSHRSVRDSNLSRDELLLQFVERAGAASADVSLTSSSHWLDDLKALCLRGKLQTLRLDTHGELGQSLAAAARVDPQWPDLLGYDQPVEECLDELFEDADAALVIASGAVAESGSVVLWSSNNLPRLLSLASSRLIVLVFASQLYGTLAELLADQGWEDSRLPAEVALLSGPSRAPLHESGADTTIYGPQRLQVLLLI